MTEGSGEGGNPSFEDLAAQVFEYRKDIETKDAQIGPYQSTIDDLNATIEAQKERINKLQGIIADHVPASNIPPKGTEGNSNKSFADMYHEMIVNNQKRINNG